MHRYLILATLALTLAGCLSAATRKELSDSRAEVDRLTLAVATADKSETEKFAALEAQLNAARASLAIVEAKAATEKVVLPAQTVEETTTALQPIIGTFLPGAALILAALGAAAGVIRRKAQGGGT
jgi:hypothetical protein